MKGSTSLLTYLSVKKNKIKFEKTPTRKKSNNDLYILIFYCLRLYLPGFTADKTKRPAIIPVFLTKF